MTEIESTEAVGNSAVAIIKETRQLMSGFGKQISQAILIGVLLVCCFGSSLRANDWMSEISAFDKTLEATLTCSSTRPFQQSKDIIVRYDPATISFYGRVISRVTKQHGKPKMWDDEHSQNSQQSSSSIRSFGSPIKQIEIKPRTHADLPSEGTILKTLQIPYAVSYTHLTLPTTPYV